MYSRFRRYYNIYKMILNAFCEYFIKKNFIYRNSFKGNVFFNLFL